MQTRLPAVVGVGERAPFKDGHAHRLEIVRGHDGEITQAPLSRLGGWLTFDAHARLPAAEAQGQRRDERRRLHAGQRADGLNRLPIKRRLPRVDPGICRAAG